MGATIRPPCMCVTHRNERKGKIRSSVLELAKATTQSITSFDKADAAALHARQHRFAGPAKQNTVTFATT
jgi:hypothetical protein